MAQLVKNLLAMREAWLQSLGWEHPPEKEMATHSSNLTWKIPRTEKPGGLQPTGSPKSWTQLSNFHFAVTPVCPGTHWGSGVLHSSIRGIALSDPGWEDVSQSRGGC